MISREIDVGVHLEMEHGRRLENKWFIIYRITNIFDGDSYIGCTFNTITQRFNQHVSRSKQSDTKLARKIRDIGRENMMIADLYSRWMTLRDAREVEGGLIDLLKPTINSKSSGKFHDVDGEWDEIEYRSKNKDKLTEKFMCECGGRYTLPHKTDHQKTRRHLSSVSVFSSPPCSPPHPMVPVVNPEDSACHSD